MSSDRYAGVGKVLCHDFTRDGRADMAVTIFSGGSAGDVAWLVFRRTDTRWRLALRRLHLYKLYLRRAGDGLVETQPFYRRDDANCCPTGGYDHVRFQWKKGRFVVVRRWHSRRLRG